jgi:hypothetical protein
MSVFGFDSYEVEGGHDHTNQWYADFQATLPLKVVYDETDEADYAAIIAMFDQEIAETKDQK